MKKIVILVLFCLYNAECRRTLPVDKKVNLDFINMEAGGSRPPAKPAAPAPIPITTKPSTLIDPVPMKPSPPKTPASTDVKPATAPASKPAPASQPAPASPAKPQPTQPSQIKPKPVNPSPVANPITTPGPGSVKQLINFYDSQGKASPIRPYSYSEAVKQG